MIHEQRLPYLKAFLYQLTEYTQRSEEDILSLGLSVYDFVHDVSIKFEDGSKMNLKNSFFVEDELSFGIFTEHCGYYIFHKDQILKIKQKSHLIKVEKKHKNKKNNKLENIKIKKLKFKDKES